MHPYRIVEHSAPGIQHDLEDEVGTRTYISSHFLREQLSRLDHTVHDSLRHLHIHYTSVVKGGLFVDGQYNARRSATPSLS